MKMTEESKKVFRSCDEDTVVKYELLECAERYEELTRIVEVLSRLRSRSRPASRVSSCRKKSIPQY